MITNPPIPLDMNQHDRLEALYHMAVELSALRSLETVLDTALEHCLALTESQFGFIGLNSSDGKAMDVVAIQGFHPSPQFYEHHHVIPLRPNVFARVVLENHPVRSEDATVDPYSVGQPPGHPPVNTFLGVPLQFRDQPIGMIGLANRPQPYNADHEQLLMTYAGQVAIVIRNAQLYEQLIAANEALEQKVRRRTQQLEAAKEALARKAEQLQKLLSETVDIQEHERQRIAQDMHDGINQLLIGALLELRSARQRMVNDNLDQAETSLDTVKQILHRVDDEIKRIVHDLRPPTLDALGLAPALRRYAERFTNYTGIPCQVRVFGEPKRLPSEIEIGFYRLVQEALQNVSVHAQAQQADIVISFASRAVKLTVIDDGVGFDLAEVECRQDGHLGLLSMQERAQSMGGNVTIQAQVGVGTQIELVVPI